MKFIHQFAILTLVWIFGFLLLWHPSVQAKELSFATGQVLITWEEFQPTTRFSDLCKDIQSDGHYIQRDGCVFWSQKGNGELNCMIFTKIDMSNALFGKLIKRCFNKK